MFNLGDARAGDAGRAMMAFPARSLAAGEAEGAVLALSRPLSFWGGLDPQTGRIVDRSHPQCGASVAGMILVMTSGRGSSSSSSVLAEALRRGTGPAGIVLGEVDPIIAVGMIVAARLYGMRRPAAVCGERDLIRIAAGAEWARVVAGEETAEAFFR